MEVMTLHNFFDDVIEMVVWSTESDVREIILAKDNDGSLILVKDDIVALAKEFELVVYEKEAALVVGMERLQAENAELAKLLTEGCNGFGSVLIQTSDMDGVNDWRKRVKEYLLIKKHRSK